MGILIGTLIAELTLRVVNKKWIQNSYNKILSTNKNIQPHNITTINKEGIRAHNPDSNKNLELTFEQINSITETTNIYILKLNDKQGLIINKNNLSGGSKEEFIQFMFNKCVNLKNKKVHQIKKETKLWKKYAIGLLLFVIISMAKPVIQKDRIKSYLELNEYKITDVTSTYSSPNIDYVLEIEKETKNEKVYIFSFKYRKAAMDYLLFWWDEEIEEDSVEQGKIYEGIDKLLLLNGKYVLYAKESEQKEDIFNLFEKLNQYL